MSDWRKALWLVCAVALACSGVSCGSSTVKLSGTGATFPEPLYKKWFQDYTKNHEKVQINYQGTGSGQGVKNIQDRTTDFGASDAAMTPEEMAKVEGGVQLLPMTAGSIVLAYNLDGVSATEALAQGVRRDLPGQDVNVERSGDRDGQPGAQAARHGRSPWLSRSEAAGRRLSSRNT